ncbi:hypothetical protein [Streptomyces sp. H27-S2]|uniref:hypothetical protein n=1 Tax=Streptomyces antarcticus TaxID=2996458 RepID=UPI00226FE341|nr:hypothetical protein [Streptomyces sp. H27-S2]MCY0950457.1 hypothetical protein [Streptomyces sp. H27-S2]
MRLHAKLRLTALAAAAALSLPVLLAAGSGSAGAVTPQAAAPAAVSRAGEPIPPNLYISPWGDAQAKISDAFLQWLRDEGVTMTAISPFTMDADGKGFSMPIGSTAGDGLDSKGRIFYPGGLRLSHAETGKEVTLKPTYIRVMPRPGWTSGVEVDGKMLAEEMPLADTKYDEVMLTARPSTTGFRLEKVPFYTSLELAQTIQDHLGRPGPAAGTLMGTLTPDFRYIPNDPNRPTVPTAPTLPSTPTLPGF